MTIFLGLGHQNKGEKAKCEQNAENDCISPHLTSILWVPYLCLSRHISRIRRNCEEVPAEDGINPKMFLYRAFPEAKKTGKDDRTGIGEKSTYKETSAFWTAFIK